jgi:subtilisin-like proprotein convertase family protein
MLDSRTFGRGLGLLFVLALAVWAISPLPPQATAAPAALFVKQWEAPEVGRASSVTWGDIDGDADLDLALSFETVYNPSCDCAQGGGVVIYSNLGSTLSLVPYWQSASVVNPASEFALDLKLIDVNRDSFLDIFYANSSGQSRIYLGGDPESLFTLAWSSSFAESYAADWADYDNDSDLDLFIANDFGPSRLYRNDTPQGARSVIMTTVLNTAAYISSDVAWGDYNNDRLPDLALGTFDKGVILFGNVADPLSPGQRTLALADEIDPFPGSVQSLAWYDYNRDGELDLAAAGYDQTIFFKNFGSVVGPPKRLANSGSINTGAAERTKALAWGDYDGDAILDLALAQSPGGLKIYQNNSTFSNTTFADIFSDGSQTSLSIAWADYDKDGDQDLALGNNDRPSVTYRSTRLEAAIKVATSFQGGPAAGALIYRQLAGSTGPFTPYLDGQGVPGRTDVSGIFDVQGDIGPGDRLVALLPAFQAKRYASADVPKVISPQEPSLISSTIQITQSGLIRDLNIVGLSGTHSYVGDLSFTLISPSGKRITFIDELCGVNNDFVLNLDDEATRELACPLTNPAPAKPLNRLSSFDGEQAAGTWTLMVRDIFYQDGGELVGWGLEIDTAPYKLYYTSAAASENGIDAPAIELGVSPTLNISTDNPLLVFDLTVSLEWDARNDQAYLEQLQFDLRRASDLLYDWSDGQVALGAINVYHDRQRWRDADVRVYATNRLRPNAQQGGVTREPIGDPASDDITYVTGQVRIGAVWNRFGNAAGTVGEDWPRALAHELSHYLLYLDDNYLGFEQASDGFDQLIAIDSCRGAMTDPYRDDYTEFHPAAEWDELCAKTSSNSETSRSDWETITTFYPELRAPAVFGANRGPGSLALALTSVSFNQPLTPVSALDSALFNIIDTEDRQLIPGESARAYLFRDGDTIVDLGRPVRNQIVARGAEPGDQICLYEPTAPRYGCANIYSGSESLTLYDATESTWPFDVQITPVTTDTIQVTVVISDPPSIAIQIDDVAGYVVSPLTLDFYQTDLFAVSRAQALSGLENTLIPLGTTLSQPIVYSATIKTAGAIDTGYLRVQVGDNSFPSRELVIDYSQIGVYDSPVASAGKSGEPTPAQVCTLPGGKRCPAKPAPTASADGQAFLYGRSVNFQFGSFYSLQGTLVQPTPPIWRVPVGRGYRFISSAGAAELRGMSLNMSYLESDVPYGAEGGLAIYYQPAAGGEWQRLPSTRSDPQRNDVSARLLGDGLYVLMTSVPLSNGWNLFSYPWQERTILDEALRRLNAGSYTTIYGYDPANTAQPWQVYDISAPPYVNSLRYLDYGRGYWLNIEGLTTAQTARAATLSADLAAQVPTPPATYYGQLLASNTLSPTAGLKVQALVGEKICGEATTQAYNNMIVFSLIVPADDGGALAGCGAPGRSVVFQVGAERLPYQASWDNARPRELRLVRLPLVRS